MTAPPEPCPADGTYAIDPVLGRIALAGDLQSAASVMITYHDGFSAIWAGRMIARANRSAGTTVRSNDHPTIAAALAALGRRGDRRQRPL